MVCRGLVIFSTNVRTQAQPSMLKGVYLDTRKGVKLIYAAMDDIII